MLLGVPDFQDRFVPDYARLSEINPTGIATEKDYLAKGDVVFVRSNGNKALVGRSLYIDREVRALFSGFCIRARISSDAVLNRFFAYFTKTPLFRRQAASSIGTNINNLNQGVLSRIEVPLYPIDTQERIVAVLSALDAKIDLNNRINAELEAMARTLYDYWFVQFDFPDENGRPYKSSGGKMVYNPVLKREIPEGWEVRRLSEIVPVGKDSVDPSRTPERIFRYYSIPEFDKTGDHDLEYGGSIGSNKFTVSGTDLLVSKLNPWFNRVVYATSEPDQICSTEFVVWRSDNEEEKNFLFSVATSQQFIAHCVGSATGTSNSHKRVNPKVMMQFAIPFQERIARRLGEIVAPTAKLIAKNRREKKQLTKLRDWLLPMLMNGQVTVE